MRLENWFITNPDISQQEVLKVPINQNLVVKGAAGSGKTNMAIYRANQAGDNTFVIVVYTVSLKKMVRHGLSELGLDKDRVVHEWSWIHRGIEISGDVFCFGTKDCNCINYNNHPCIDENILILKEADGTVRFFVYFAKKYNDQLETSGIYNKIIETSRYKGYGVKKIDNPLEVSIDFDDWVHNRFYYNFYRRTCWFKEVEFVDFQLDTNASNIVFIPSGFLFKEKGIVNYLIIDEGQDFSISDYKQNFIAKANKAITIFGDTSQQIYTQRGTNIDNIVSTFGYNLLNLNFNYRVPKTIAKVAQKIPLPNIDLLINNRKNNGNSDYPDFPKPIIKECNSELEEIQFIIDRINTEGLDDVAILLPDNEAIMKVHKFLSEKNIEHQTRFTVDSDHEMSRKPFIKVDTLKFENLDLPCIITYHSAKGLEFDNVFIPFANEDTKGLTRNPFYVAVTRSSYRIFITYSRKLTRFIEIDDKVEHISKKPIDKCNQNDKDINFSTQDSSIILFEI
ncbi:MAG: ATP-binding domain-containing protein [Prevotellaceae bacterium]|jgi:superfamily I DNA/RNA helicase|nr:ATP-binding domain-containing protein [Prevotellaceae bacterium]